MVNRVYRDREWLEREYCEKKRTTGDIAQECGCGSESVRYWLIKYSIPRRSTSTPEGRKHLSEIKKKNGKQHSEAMKRAWMRGTYDRVFDSPEFSKKQAKLADLRWASGCYGEEYVRKQKETTKAAWERGAYDGVHQTDVVRKKCSRSIIAAWVRGDYDSPETKRKQSAAMKGRKFTAETRLRMSIARKDAWERGVYDDRNLRLQGVPKSTEVAMRTAFIKHGIKFETQYRIPGKSRPYDFYIEGLDCLIECQGDYYHNDTNFPGISASDEEKRQEALAAGYMFVEVWERDIVKYGAWEAAIQGIKDSIGDRI